MKIEYTEDGRFVVTFRQSWLGDTALCLERGRRAIVEPEKRRTNDSAAIGTAVHAGIEAHLNGTDVAAAIDGSWAALVAEGVTSTLGWTEQAWRNESYALYWAWEKGILPHVTPVKYTEHSFDVPFYNTEVNGVDVEVRLSGTIDAVCEDGTLWDWKTAARSYSEREKQNTAVQPTVYATACSRLGLTEYPSTFNFGVLIREKHTPQVVSVTRSRNHEVWLGHMTEPLVRQGILLGLDSPWPVNDTSALCSQKWCNWYEGCRGSALTTTDMYNGGIPTSNPKKKGK